VCSARHRLQLMAIPLTKTQNLSDTQQSAPRFFTNVCSVFELTLLCSCIRDIRASMLKTQQVTEKCSCLFCIHAIPGVKLKNEFISCISLTYVRNKRPTAESRFKGRIQKNKSIIRQGLPESVASSRFIFELCFKFTHFAPFSFPDSGRIRMRFFLIYLCYITRIPPHIFRIPI